jgi:hypothetical protein
MMPEINGPTVTYSRAEKLSSDQLLAKFGLTSALIQLVLLALYGANTDELLLGGSPTFLTLFSALVSANLLRIALCLFQPNFGPWLSGHFGRQTWSVSYRVVSLFCGVIWGACQYVLIDHKGFASSDASIGYILISGLAAWCSLSLAHAPKSARGMITLMITPVFLALVTVDHPRSHSMALAYFLYFIFLQYLVSAQQRGIKLAQCRLDQLESLTESAKNTMVAGLDSIPGIAWILNGDGSPRYFNKKGLEYLG